MAKARGPAQPVISRPAQWVVGKRVKDRVRTCAQCGVTFKPERPSRGQFCSRTCVALGRRREVPADFEETFIELGFAGCRWFYDNARFAVVTRWLEVAGKERLQALRLEYLRKAYEAEQIERQSRRDRDLAIAEAKARHSMPVEDVRVVHPAIAQLAANFLRTVRNGGWLISKTGQGDYWVGSGRKSPAQLVDLAERYGFEAAGADLTIDDDDGVGSA